MVVQIGMATRFRVFNCVGFEEVAVYLKQTGPKDAALYDGHYYGIFGFYLLLGDPDRERRLVRPDQLLADAKSERDAIEAIRSDPAIRWIVLESGVKSQNRATFQLLQKVVQSKDFRWVRTFPNLTPGVPKIELYEFIRTNSDDREK
jgi:hypothetical protein